MMATLRTPTASVSQNATRTLALEILVATTTSVTLNARATSASAKLATRATSANLMTNVTRTTNQIANLARNVVTVNVSSRAAGTSMLTATASKRRTSVFSEPTTATTTPTASTNSMVTNATARTDTLMSTATEQNAPILTTPKTENATSRSILPLPTRNSKLFPSKHPTITRPPFTTGTRSPPSFPDLAKPQDQPPVLTMLVLLAASGSTIPRMPLLANGSTIPRMPLLA